MRRKLLIAGLCLLGALLALAGGLYWYLRPGVVFLERIIDGDTPVRQLADAPWAEREVRINGPVGTLRARIYQPSAGLRRTILLVHGIHHRGIDEERLVPLAQKLAGMGYLVVTPELPDLANYEIQPRTVDQIERAALWLLARPELMVGDGKLAIFGISFGGGLSVSAASRPSLSGRLAFVLSFGGHADLDRVMRYLVSGRLPEGGELPAHIYAVAVLLRQFAERMVPAEQVGPLRRCVYVYLKGDTERARKLQQALPPPARELAGHCLARESAALGRKLAAQIGRVDSPASLSPLRCPAPGCPVFLLHGSVDNVIPPSESVGLARYLAGETSAHLLVSPLVVHVEVETTGWRPMWDLLLFSTRWLRL